MPKGVKYAAFRLVVIITATFSIVAGYMYLNQKDFIYFPDGQDFDACPGFAESEKIREGETRMYYTDASSKTVVVYYHGNAGSACDRAFIKDELKNARYSSLFVEYSGYSGDDRTPSRDLILKDAENADKFLGRLGYERVVLMGTSLGSAVAAYHQTLRTPDKMILFTPFDKLSSVGKTHYPFLPVKTLLKEEYDTAGWMKDYTGEIIIIHGKNDEIIPIKHAEALYGMIPSEEKTLVGVDGETHNTLLGSAEVWETVMNFLKN